MATQQEIAYFFRLTLRLRVVDTASVERWADSVIATEDVARFPFTELASASRLPSTTVDDLLGQVTGSCEPYASARIALALLRRRIRDGLLAPETAIKHALEIASSGPLKDRERFEAFRLEDHVWLAANEGYGTVDDVRREITELFERYAEFDEQIPAAI
ncbi:MAG: hypothetical protein WCV00_15805 [Verrucomicrobiia bacterium]|jgi:hypothetical protein